MGCCGTSKNKKPATKIETTRNLSPIDQLKICLARGEISFVEYKKVKAELEK